MIGDKRIDIPWQYRLQAQDVPEATRKMAYAMLLGEIFLL